MAMQVLSLCKQLCPDKITYNTTVKIGYGVDGEVFRIENSPDQVIKYCILYDNEDDNLQKNFEQIRKVLSHLCDYPSPVYARVHNYECFGKFSHQSKSEEFILYCYVMEKLYPITKDEGRVFHTIVSHEDRGISKDYSREKRQDIIRGLAVGLDFDSERVMFFCDNIRNSPVQHHDLHERNIMKDCFGNFKLVDLDRTIIEWRKDNEQ